MTARFPGVRRAAAAGVLVFAVSAEAGPAAHAERARPRRVRLDVGGAFAAASAAFSESRSITQFAEKGTIDARYEGKAGPGFEAGLRCRLWRRLGASIGTSFFRQGGAGSFSATFPHPLYFGRPRTASGAMDGLARRETAVHVDFDYSVGHGPLDLHLFAGPTWMRVRTDLLEDVSYRQSYPYDSVEVTRVSTRPVGNSAPGFNAGAGLDYRMSGLFAVGAQVRFTRVRTTLRATPTSTLDVEGGGLQAGFGVRLLL